MSQSDPFSPRETPLTKILCDEPVLITSLHVGEDFLLIGSVNGCVYRLDFSTERVEILAKVDSVWSLAREGSAIIFGSANGEIHLFYTQSRGSLHSIGAHGSLVGCLEFLDNNTLVSGARDGTLRTWDVGSGSLNLKAELIGHTAAIRGLKAHGDTVVSGSYDTDVRVWNALTGECLKVLRGHRSRVHSVEYNGMWIATSSEDRDIRVWDPEIGSCIAILEGYGAQGVRVALLCLAGDMLIAGCADGSINSWSLPSKNLRPRVLSQATGSGISDLNVEGSLIVSGSSAGVVKVINRYSGDMVAKWRGGSAIFQVGFTVGNSLVAVYRKDGSNLVTIL